jgi:hypothetical protein
VLPVWRPPAELVPKLLDGLLVLGGALLQRLAQRPGLAQCPVDPRLARGDGTRETTRMGDAVSRASMDGRGSSRCPSLGNRRLLQVPTLNGRMHAYAPRQEGPMTEPLYASSPRGRGSGDRVQARGLPFWTREPQGLPGRGRGDSTGTRRVREPQVGIPPVVLRKPRGATRRLNGGRRRTSTCDPPQVRSRQPATPAGSYRQTPARSRCRLRSCRMELVPGGRSTRTEHGQVRRAGAGIIPKPKKDRPEGPGSGATGPRPG